MSDNGVRFNKRARLLKPAEFSRVFKQAIRSSDRLLTILAISNHLSYPRLGLAISKKNAKRAIDRNRIKRVIRESFRLNQGKLPGIDCVVLAKPATRLATNAEIAESLDKHWNRLTKQCEKLSSD